MPPVLGSLNELSELVHATHAEAAIVAFSPTAEPELRGRVLARCQMFFPDRRHDHGIGQRCDGRRRTPSRRFAGHARTASQPCRSSQPGEETRIRSGICDGDLIALVARSICSSRSGIKLDSRGPILYRQRRLGRKGRPFRCLKFRTMHADADRRLHEVLEAAPEAAREFAERFKLRDDPRVTRFGRLLRKSSLDELPQFFNVLRGEMSVVGPRPDRRGGVGALRRLGCQSADRGGPASLVTGR